jgi:hypothetical protein
MKPKNEELPKIDIDLKNTTPIYSADGNAVFQEGLILRKVSRLLTGAPKDSLMPIQIFYDVKTGKVLKDTLPKDLWEEFGYKE